MKIAFRQIGSQSRCYLAELRSFEYSNHLLIKSYIEQIKNILTEKFLSVSLDVEHNTLFFIFDDDADEAAFLLWSSDGIEL